MSLLIPLRATQKSHEEVTVANCRNSLACFRLQNIRTDVMLILHCFVGNEWPIYRLLSVGHSYLY